MGVSLAVPEAGIFHLHGHIPPRYGRHFAGGRNAITVQNGVAGHGPLSPCDVRGDLHCTVGLGVDLYSLGAIVEQVEVGALHLDQLNITVDAAVVVKVAGQGVDIAVTSVVGVDGEGVGPFHKCLVHRKTEGRVATPVLAQQLAIHLHFTDAGHGFKLDKVPLFQLACIHPESRLVDTFASLAGIILVPDVRQCDILPGLRLRRGQQCTGTFQPRKTPVEGIERIDRSHKVPSSFISRLGPARRPAGAVFLG